MAGQSANHKIRWWVLKNIDSTLSTIWTIKSERICIQCIVWHQRFVIYTVKNKHSLYCARLIFAWFLWYCSRCYNITHFHFFNASMCWPFNFGNVFKGVYMIYLQLPFLWERWTFTGEQLAMWPTLCDWDT